MLKKMDSLQSTWVHFPKHFLYFHNPFKGNKLKTSKKLISIFHVV